MLARIVSCLPVIFGFLMVTWAVEVVNNQMGHQLSTLGIVPRTVNGLIGIPLAPFYTEASAT